MEVDLPLYTIRPHHLKGKPDGYLLIGPLLPDGRWHATAQEAVAYARLSFRQGLGILVKVHDSYGVLYRTLIVPGAGILAPKHGDASKSKI